MASRREQAGIPTGPGMRAMVLELLKEIPNPVKPDQIGAAIASKLKLTEEQMSVMEPGHGGTDGHRSYVDWQCNFACSDLSRIGVCERPAKGQYQLTAFGRTVSSEDVEKLYRKRIRDDNMKRKQASPTSSATAEPINSEAPKAPEDDWTQQLIEQLSRMSPVGFEHLSRSLLRAAGFDDVEVSARSGDGGIDGIGVYRPAGLISFHTAFQCKRYQGSVSASTVRDFRGSLDGRADRGIIITTGYFTRDAQAEASRPGAKPIDLIDGDGFCELLREHSLGVKTTQRTVEDVTVDDAYFAQFEDPR